MRDFNQRVFDALLDHVINVQQDLEGPAKRREIAEKTLNQAGVLGPIGYEKSVFLDTVQALSDEVWVHHTQNLYPYLLGSLRQQLWKQYRIWFAAHASEFREKYAYGANILL